ncbi:MAG: molybdopterin-dependent oxidoreductase [Deltaproteobacteria bacterium]|nr:molybdopterin-dependent oxidoreductase [Deltaproteobacteria bacterium]
MSEGHRIIGRNLRKIDAIDKVTGRTRYADDVVLPRMLYCKLLRSPVAHANIKRIDLSGALAQEGVVAAISGETMPTAYGILPVSEDEHALCIDKVRFIGDPVAAVAAETEHAAELALDAIELELEPLETIGSVEKAINTPEPRIHPGNRRGNIHKLVSLEFGDIEQAFAEADHVEEGLFHYGGNTHLAMEQHAAVADWSPDGRLTLWSSTQTPHYVHRVLAKVLDLPAAQVRVIATPNGGGFGGKTDPFNHELAVCKLAMLTGRPVKICLTREEVFYCHRGRHATLIQARTAVKRDGTITGMHFRTLLDGGAYGSYGVASTFYTGALQTVTYEVPHYRFDGGRLFTNKPPCGPKRGHGTPQPRFALEIQLDRIAAALRIDPADLRLQQIQPANSLTSNYLRIGSIGLAKCIKTVVEASGWRERYGKLERGRGLGLACSSYLSGAGLPIYWNEMPHSAATVKLDRGGGVTVFCGSTDVGQGSDSVLAFVVAEELGIDPYQIRVVTADTDLTPVDLGSYSSRVTVMTGHATRQAAAAARERVRSGVAEKLAVSGEQITFADGKVRVAEKGIELAFAEAVAIAEARHGTIVTSGSYKPPETAGKFKGAGVGPSPAYSYSAGIVEVEVDEQTGFVTPIKVWMAHDIGQAINRSAVIGQVEGSVYMGLGEALMEEMVYREKRNLVHKIPSMLEYKSLTSLEMCEVETFLIEDPDPNGPYGAKEVGQGPLLPMPPAIANAVYDAVGVRVDMVPVTPSRVMAALDAAARGKAPRHGPERMPQVSWPEPTRVTPPWAGGDGHAQRPGSGKQAS